MMLSERSLDDDDVTTTDRSIVVMAVYSRDCERDETDRKAHGGLA